MSREVPTFSGVALPHLRFPGHGQPVGSLVAAGLSRRSGLVSQRVYTFRPRQGKISSGCPLAHDAFGVWITPLSVSRRSADHPSWPAPQLPLEVIEWMAVPTGSSTRS